MAEAQDESSNDWEIAYETLKFDTQVGEGTFGTVHRGKFWGTDVAIKTLKTDSVDVDDQMLGDLRKEAAIMSKLRHPNVVLYMGMCESPKICMVTEFCPKGSLFDILYDYEDVINFQMMMKIAIGIAQGMTYLHNLKRKIIHRDLKPHNVLLSDDWTPKICDFGISHVRQKIVTTTRAVNSNAKHYGVVGTPEWMAPEVMQGQPYDESADVYSFGILLSEILSRQMPFRDQYEINNFMDIVDAVIDEEAIPLIPDWVDFTLRDIITTCLDRKMGDRPKFSYILKTLQKYEDEDMSTWFLKYDLPRLRHMIEGEKTTHHMLASREIASIVRDPTKEIPLNDIKAFVAELSDLLQFPNSFLQRDVTASLVTITSYSHHKDLLTDIMISHDCESVLLQMIEYNKDDEDEQVLVESCNILLNIVQNIMQTKREVKIPKLAMPTGRDNDLSWETYLLNSPSPSPNASPSQSPKVDSEFSDDEAKSPETPMLAHPSFVQSTSIDRQETLKMIRTHRVDEDTKRVFNVGDRVQVLRSGGRWDQGWKICLVTDTEIVATKKTPTETLQKTYSKAQCEKYVQFDEDMMTPTARLLLFVTEKVGKDLISKTQTKNIVVMTVKTTDSAMEFFDTNYAVSNDPEKFRVVTDLRRDTEAKGKRHNAGAATVRALRKMKYTGPILVTTKSGGTRKGVSQLLKKGINMKQGNVYITDDEKKVRDFCTFVEMRSLIKDSFVL